MHVYDWLVLGVSLIGIVVYGVWKGRGSKDMKGYLRADNDMRWWTVALSIMATQASAITFISTPGQAYADGMRFVQFYFGLPIAMVILSVTAVPLYHKLKVFTAYEFLEQQFDLKTRALAAGLFLIQRGLGAGLTIFAPSIILSVLLGWNLYITNLIMGGLVIIYTASGGARAVSWTQFQQVLIILFGMVGAFGMMVYLMPDDISFFNAVQIAGKMEKLNAVDFSFDWNNRYNIWSGILGGLFLQLSYFGTDQSQVGRYLTGQSVTQSRLGLLCNGLVKIPMQFVILFIGAMMFVFYQFVTPPLSFNSVEADKIKASAYADTYRSLELQHETLFKEKEQKIRELVGALESGDHGHASSIEKQLDLSQEQQNTLRKQAADLMIRNDPAANTNDTNYIFLNFVIHYLPVGLVGLVIAAIFAASMSSTSAELNSLASTTVIDVYKRLINKNASERQYVIVSKLATVMWGIFAIIFAEYANRLGSLIEAVNILGSLFYGTILGIFLLAFYFKFVRGTAAFYAAILGEIAVVCCFAFTEISFLWYNVIGCLLTMGLALVFNLLIQRKIAHG